MGFATVMMRLCSLRDLELRLRRRISGYLPDTCFAPSSHPVDRYRVLMVDRELGEEFYASGTPAVVD
jgi:hypothetical protein